MAGVKDRIGLQFHCALCVLRGEKTVHWGLTTNNSRPVRHLLSRRESLRSSVLCALTSIAVLLIHGFHPFAEDAGIYTVCIRKLADPALYQPDAAFALANTRFSVFPSLFASLMRSTGIPLSALLLATHLLTIFAFLLACMVLARRLFESAASQWFAVALAAACFTLPATGTALLLMDPYVTPRSFSTPLGLFAVALAIDRRTSATRALLGSALLLFAAALMHPLMAVYAAVIVLLVFLVNRGRTRLAIIFSAVAPLSAAAVYLIVHEPSSPAYRQAILLPAHSYLFPTHWVHRDYIGVAAPIVFFALIAHRFGRTGPPGRVSIAALLSAVSSTLSAFLFIRPHGSFLLAALQPMRSFQMLYIITVLLAGGLIGSYLPPRSPSQDGKKSSSRFILLSLPIAIAVLMFFVQRHVYSASAHVECPEAPPRNPWQQAFLWIRDHTPSNAVFAANPGLIFLEGEDSQGFRAIAVRSLLANDKDSGLVVVFPPLAAQWAIERNAQLGLDKLSDPERLARLRPLGVSWLLLSSTAVTSLPCPYRNAVAQVCRLVPAQK